MDSLSFLGLYKGLLATIIRASFIFSHKFSCFFFRRTEVSNHSENKKKVLLNPFSCRMLNETEKMMSVY